MKILDTSKAVAKRIQQLLNDYNINSNTSKAENIFLCTGREFMIRKFLNNDDKISKITI